MSMSRVSPGQAQAQDKQMGNLPPIALEEDEDVDILNEDYDDITEIESNHIDENLDNLEALIFDTKSKWLDFALALTTRREAGQHQTGEF